MYLLYMFFVSSFGYLKVFIGIYEFSYSYNLLGSLHEKIKKNEEANAMIQEAVWN